MKSSIDTKLSSLPPLKDKYILSTIKDHVKERENILKERHMHGASGEDIVREYTLLIDELVTALYKRFEQDYNEDVGRDCALIAIGGYGRGELNPRSDIDLMFLYHSKVTPFVKKISEDILYLLWDTGLDVGFSVRSCKECIGLATDDLKTRTSLLDCRFLTGDKKRYEDFLKDFHKKVIDKNKRLFIEKKIGESLLRHKRYWGSVYILEPNIKDGEGGLRDLHTAMWIAKTEYGVCDLKGLLDYRLASREDIVELEDAREFLWKIRNDLHFHANRKVDQLNFEAQERIARLFSFEDHHSFLGVEDFMRQYYLHASNIRHHASLIISSVSRNYETMGVVRKIRKKRVDGDFSIYGGRLVVASDNLFQREPEKIMKMFEYRQSLGVELDARTRELMCENLSVVDDLRGSVLMRDSFMSILSFGERVFETLQMMHTLRFLERYIPEFGDITCRVQHDLYHIYTVDVHSLFAVREIEFLREKEGEKRFPFLSGLLKDIERCDLLFLAVLFHDIGKAGGKGHSEIGVGIVSKIMDRMGFPEEDKRCVSFLVRHHLLLANLAQHRDLHDTKLIIEFVKTIGSVENLTMLYLLTFADIKAIGPQVWTQWKAILFHELYSKARNMLEKGIVEIAGVRERLEKVKEILCRIGEEEIDRDIIDKYFKRFPARYLLSNKPEDLKTHIKIVSRLNGKDFVIQTIHKMEKGYTKVLICTYDTNGLFSKIAGVMASNNVNVLGARINTSGDGIALDILYVNSSIGDVITDEMKWRKIKKDFKNVIEGRVGVEDLVRKKRPSMLERKFKPKVPTRVIIDNEVSEDFTVIDIYTEDRIGVLYNITSALSRLRLYIYVSKIATKGGEATDIFYVKDIFGHKITSEERLEEIKTVLYGIFEKVL